MRASLVLTALTAIGCGVQGQQSDAEPAALTPPAPTTAASARSPAPRDDVAALVNGSPITKAEYEVEVEHNMARYRSQGHVLPPGIEAKIRESVLKRMIDDKIIALKAAERSVAVTPGELEEKFEEYKARFRTQEGFDDYLKRSGNTVENMKRDLERNMVRDRLVEAMTGDLEVTDTEVQQYYQENIARFVEREQIRASRILIRANPGDDDATRRKARKRASDLRAKLLRGGDFATLARQGSQGPEASRDGELGWLTRGRMTPEFDNAAFALTQGTSEVVESVSGFEIIQVWEKKPEHQRALEEVAESIKNSLMARKRNEARRDVLRDLKGAVKVELFVETETQSSQTTPEPQPSGLVPEALPPQPTPATQP